MTGRQAVHISQMAGMITLIYHAYLSLSPVSPILRHSAPPCYIIEITDCPAPDFRPTDHVFHKLSSQIPANIGNSASSAFSWIRLPRLTAAASRSTCSDLMAPAGISQGAHGTTWVAGIRLASIRRRTIL